MRSDGKALLRPARGLRDVREESVLNRRDSRWVIAAILFVSGLLWALLTLTHLDLSCRKTESIVSGQYVSFEAINNTPGIIEFRWEALEPSRDLIWHPCYDFAHDCARLSVPLDWLDASELESQRVVLAVIRLRASLSNSSNYRGPVFFNPGGPGGSGVFALRDHGIHLQTIIGKNHDLVSFDPRGIGASVPRIDCWANSPEKARLWNLQDVGVVDSHPGVIHDAFARATAFSQACEANMRDSCLLRHIGTASHARDMLEILERMGEEKLKYWGFSYGTVLGGVFASMWPDKVERLVSDGNVDIREWHFQTHINFIRDTDKVMAAFYKFCHRAGPSGCDFFANTPSLIRQRLGNLFVTLRRYPVILPAAATGSDLGGRDMPLLITWSHVRRLTSAALYRPTFMFKRFARVLRALEEGDGLPFYQLIQSESSAPPPICSIDPVAPDVPRLQEGNEDAFKSILCADHYPLLNDTLEEFEAHVEQLRGISTAAGDVNALFRLACVGRTVEPKWRYTGMKERTHSLDLTAYKWSGPFEGNTSYPILYIANMADPISPLVSATNNSQGFPGSVILVQRSYGHTSLSAASTCTAQHIHAYFREGKLPEPGTECEPDCYPFEDTLLKGSESELAIAAHKLSEAKWGFTARLNL